MANCVQCGRKLPSLTFGKKICPWCVQHEAAQRGELDDSVQQRVMPTPWVRRESTITLTHVIFGANVAVFIAMVLASGSVDFAHLDPRPWGANYGPFTLSGQWWRLFTYMFLHGDIIHIGMNMWCLWNLGPLCEAVYGRWTYAAVYVITGIAGGLASVAWNPGVLSVGASGAIFGLAGALIASFYLGEFSLSGISIRGTLSSLVFFAVFNLAFGGFFGGIDNACHIGGLVSGLILGALIARAAPQNEAIGRRVGVLALVALLVATAGLGVQRWRGLPMRRFAIAEESAQKSVTRMIAELQKKVQQSPRDASAHYALAHAYFTEGDWQEGVSELKRVLELEPKNTDARFDLASSYLNQQQPKLAQEQFAELVSENANDADAHVGLGMALAEQRDNASAVEEYKTALHLAPQARGVYYQMGVSQFKLKQYDDAISSYLGEKNLSGDDSPLEMALAEAYEAKGMTAEAAQAKAKAEELSRQNPSAR
jgi:membrane associated rhomboid family serine protease/Flp pilus assembly protein TadD